MEDMRLFELADAVTEVVERGIVFDEYTGEVYFDSDDLEALEARIEEKLNGCANVVTRFEGNIDMIDAEIKRLQAVKKHYTSGVGKLKWYMTRQMQRLDGKVELPTHIISMRRAQAVDVFDPDELPEEYVRVKVTRDPDKRAIAKALKSGEEVPGAALVAYERLVIK